MPFLEEAEQAAKALRQWDRKDLAAASEAVAGYEALLELSEDARAELAELDPGDRLSLGAALTGAGAGMVAALSRMSRQAEEAGDTALHEEASEIGQRLKAVTARLAKLDTA